MSSNFEETIHVQTSHVLLTVMPEYLVCTGSLGPLGYQVVMVEMDAKESKVIWAAQGRLDLRDHQALKELRAPKENLEYSVLLVKRGSLERVWLLVWCLLRTGKSVRGRTWMLEKISASSRWIVMILRGKIIKREIVVVFTWFVGLFIFALQ